MVVHEPTFLELSVALRATAAGILTSEAAVEMLIAQRTWLHSEELRRHIEIVPGIGDGHAMASIDWRQVATAIDTEPSTASDNEVQFLKITVMVAGHGAWPLGDLITGLDDIVIRIALNGIAHAAGWHSAGHAATVNGVFRRADDSRAQRPRGLPAYNDMCEQATILLSDARDVMNSDWRPDGGPTKPQADARARFWKALDAAKTALATR